MSFAVAGLSDRLKTVRDPMDMAASGRLMQSTKTDLHDPKYDVKEPFTPINGELALNDYKISQ